MQLKASPYAHTYDVLDSLKNNNIMPEWVQVGNESNGAFFYEIIPQIDGRTTALGVDSDFKAITGAQSVAFSLGTGVLASLNETTNVFAFNIPQPGPGSCQRSLPRVRRLTVSFAGRSQLHGITGQLGGECRAKR